MCLSDIDIHVCLFSSIKLLNLVYLMFVCEGHKADELCSVGWYIIVWSFYAIRNILFY